MKKECTNCRLQYERNDLPTILALQKGDNKACVKNQEFMCQVLRIIFQFGYNDAANKVQLRVVILLQGVFLPVVYTSCSGHDEIDSWSRHGTSSTTNFAASRR